MSDLLPDALAYVSLLSLVSILSGVYLVLLRILHRILYGRRGPHLGPLAKSLYLIPAMVIVWVGLTFSDSVHLIGLGDLNWSEWLGLVLFTSWLGLNFLKRRLGMRGSVAKWVRSWPGWRGDSTTAPYTVKSADLASLLTFPALALMLSIVDLVGKVANIFKLVPAVGMALSAFVMVAGCVALAFYVMTQTREETREPEVRHVLVYPRWTRVTTVAAAIFALSAWGASAAYEPEGDLHIASYQLPEPTARNMSIVLVSKSNKPAVLKEFQIESKSASLFFYCLSADFDIPVVGGYVLPFQVQTPLTTIKADPVKQFPPSQAGRINLALRPNATGVCSDHWRARIRVAVVSDDGKRAKTEWFTLQKANKALLGPIDEGGTH